MPRHDKASRRHVLKATVGAGVLGMLAGCGDGGDGGDGEDGDGGTPTETESDDLEAVSIGGTEEPSNGTETAETTGNASIRRWGPGDGE